MKTVHVAFVLALISSSAQAWELRTTCASSRFYGTSSCRTLGIPDPVETRDYAQEAEDRKARLEGIRKWEAFCKPTRRHDDLGVVRLSYARNGCEFGVSE